MSWLQSVLSISLILQFALQPTLGAEVSKTPPIEAEAIARHIRFLSSDELQGRRSGTEGCVKAGEYIASEFKRFGLKPFGTDYYQHFDFVSGLKVESQSSFKLKAGGRKTTLRLGIDYQPLNFSSGVTYKGEILLTGFGIKADKLNYNDFAGMNLRGKAVLILPYSPEGSSAHSKFADYLSVRRKALSAREQGASVAIFISEAEDLSGSRGEDANFTDAGIAAVRISRKIADLILAPLGKTVEQLMKDGEKNAKGTISALEKVRLELKLKLSRETKKTSNVIGVIEGSDIKNEYIVLGAHYDHLGLGGSSSLAPDRKGIHHGADDNASGVSGLLELARILSVSRAQLRRSVIFAAFSGEEEGLLGSAHYVKSPPVPIENTVAMLNMDMIGRMRDDKLVIGGMGTSPMWRTIVEDSNRTRGLVLAYQDDGYGPSDHASFYARDLPVLFFFTGNHEDYHKPSDTHDKINVISIQTIIALVRDIALRVVNDDKRPQFTKATASDTRRAGNTFRVALGTVPDYSAQVDGMKLSGVRPDSPAEKAGMQAGDILVELAGRKITSVYDYTYVLQELKPNQTVDAVVTRDGKRLELKVTPVPR